MRHKEKPLYKRLMRQSFEMIIAGKKLNNFSNEGTSETYAASISIRAFDLYVDIFKQKCESMLENVVHFS